MKLSGNEIRNVLLQVLKEYDKQGPSYFQSTQILIETSKRLNITGDLPLEQALLTFFHDLFRNGYLAWGYNIHNAGPPFCHLTEQGRETLKHISRDPINPDGYLEYIYQNYNLGNISESYLKEALTTYNSNCFKATAVMVGAASESIILELRDELIRTLKESNLDIPRDLKDWRVKTILSSLQTELEKRKRHMPGTLRDKFVSYWPAFTQQIRAARNEAGHPADIDPITNETVHASLLIFPELVSLSNELQNWISELDFQNT